MSGAQASQILEAVTRAADAAAQAALALKESNEQARAQKGGFSEASKVVKCPTSFGSANSAEDQSNWFDFAFFFKQWLVYAEPGFETDLKHVEDHLNVPVSYTASAEGVASEARSIEAVCDPFRSFATTTFEAVEASAQQQWHGGVEAIMQLVHT